MLAPEHRSPYALRHTYGDLRERSAEAKRREVLAFASVDELKAVGAELSRAFAALPVFDGLTGLRSEEWLALGAATWTVARPSSTSAARTRTGR